MAQTINDFTLVNTPSLNLSDYQYMKSTKYQSGIELQTLANRSKSNNPIIQKDFGPSNGVWIGETETSVLNFKKLMISTNFDFDVYANLKRTSTNIRLNKLFSYRVF